MLSTAEFKEWGKSVVLFAHVTTRIEGRKYEGLLSEKGGRGFPHLVAMNAAGDVTAVAKGRSVDAFKTMVESGAKYDAMLKKADKSLDDKLFIFEHQIALGTLKLAAAQEQVAALGDLTPEQKKKIDGVMLGLEIDAVNEKMRGLPRTEEAQKRGMIDAGATFAKMLAAGREPKMDDLGRVQFFYISLLENAVSVKDVGQFEAALGKLKQAFGSNPRAKGFFDKQEERLAELRDAAGGDDSE